MIIAQCAHYIVTYYGLTISMFLAGLVGGSTHCVIMCSPFILAQVGNNVSIKNLGSYLLLPYHFGRLTTYVVMALLLNSIINLAFLYSDLKSLVAAPMLALAGVMFLVSAFPKLSIIFPWAASVKISSPYKYINKLSSRVMANNSVFGRYLLGVLLGFLPCGLVVSALLASASAPDMLHAGLAMAAFAVGTMPALFIVAFGGQMLKNKYSLAVSNISKIAMLISAIWLFVLAAQMII